MIEIKFHVRGNQEDMYGNPIPYQRTLNHSWTKAATRYKDWMDYVRAEFVRSFILESKRKDIVVVTTDGHIELERGQTAEVELDVSWANGHHGDLDNVLKGVLDSLFIQDKEIVRISAKVFEGVVGGSIHGRVIINEV